VVISGREEWLRNRQLLAETGHILMSRACKWMALGLVLAAPVLLAQSSPTPATAQPAAPTPPQHHKSHKSNKTPKPIVLPPLPSGPLSQLPMDQIPATKATVSFEGGLLTISAQNSTLGEILRDVRKLTGASIEIPQGSAASERVVTHLGPGAPRDVMAGLLNGSSFDYVMLGSSSDPAAISSVILLAKPSLGDKPGDNQTAANGLQGPMGAMPPNGGPPQPFNRQQIAQMPGQPVNGQPANAQDDSKDDDPDTVDDNADDQAQPPNPNGAIGQDQQQQPDPNQPNAGPKTPEQILEMLQRQRQQQAGPGAPGAPPPQPPQPPQE